MKRYFIEVSYVGDGFGGFQIQQNQQTIQGALEAAMATLYRATISLTGASRTDAGVHALQNFFHFDTAIQVTAKHIYNLNAILPNSIVVNGIYNVPSDESFTKKNTTVNTFDCIITKAEWTQEGSLIQFNIDSNRFLRGMIRGLVGTMLQVGRGQINLDRFEEIIRLKNEQNVDFSTPAHGLYLSKIVYPDYFQKML